MKDFMIERVERENLKVEIRKGDELVIHFTGAIREQHPEDWLNEFFRRITYLITDRDMIVLDFRDLEFMNATAFRSLIPWLSALQKRTVPCKARILTKKSVMWQNVAICSLKVIAEDMIISETY